MDRTSLDVTRKELSVLHFLWDQGPATIRQITDALYPNGTEVHCPGGLPIPSSSAA